MNGRFAPRSAVPCHFLTIASAMKDNKRPPPRSRPMFNTIKTAALSAVIALGTLAAIPATAQADSLYLNFGGPGAGIGMRFGDSGHSWREHDRRHDRRAERCTPERALWKADRMGINRARVVDVDRHTIVVRGRSRGDRVHVVFGRSEHCPVIR